MKFLTPSFALLLFIAIALPQAVQSQHQQDHEHSLNSTIFETERQVRVFLPKKYFEDTQTDFIVTYILDAQSDQVWNMAKSNIDYLVQKYTIIPTIAVGIVSENRGKEFSPLSAEKLQQHLTQEVFPLIKDTYRIHNFKVVVGHSWGGAFVGHTLFSENRNLFDAYIGISPSLDAHDNVIFNQASSLLEKETSFRKYFFFSAGDVGFEKEYKLDRQKMEELLNKYPNKSLAWNTRYYQGKDHFSAFIPALNDGLVAMSRNYLVDQKAIEEFAQNNLQKSIETFYKKQQARFDQTFNPGTNYLKNIADDFRDNEDYQNAITLYKWALEQDPQNVRAQINLGDTYDKMQEDQLAKKAFSKSLEMLEAQKEQLSERFYEIFQPWLSEKLAKYK